MSLRLLDLFCGGGGAGMGYSRAGFEVTGVDHRPMPRYPFSFVQADALEYLKEYGAEFDVIHASPPCQKFSSATFCRPEVNSHPDLIVPTIGLLQKTGRPWIVENVMPAPLSSWGTVLCGLMFGLKVLRHRRFESSLLLFAPYHPTHRGIRIGVNGFCTLAGHGGGTTAAVRRRCPPNHRNKAAWMNAIGVDWMTRDELAQAIPPAYTQYLGSQLRRILEG